MNIASIIEKCLDLDHFEVGRSAKLLLVHRKRETIFWELFHGRALDAAMTRQQATFESWNIVIDPAAAEPLISVKWDPTSHQVFVTRAILCHAHEVVPNDSNVIETRATTRWVRELVAQFRVAELSHNELEGELQAAIGQAVYGTSRLPLTSLETPLPQFLLGQLGYFPPGHGWRFRELEWHLRAQINAPESNRDNNHFTLTDLRHVILHVSLSPYTSLVSNMLQWLRGQQQLGRISIRQRAEFLAWLLRLQWRHLNAYDLRKFHHRGANYPDALLIDDVLRELLAIIDTEAMNWTGAEAAPLRRGLRWGWFLRMMYAGQPVPARPTSPGENLRVMPFEQVPDEQILQLHQRPRQLFDQPLPWSDCAVAVLQQSLDELREPKELQELGTALILDRPLGIDKAPGEPDATPILAHVVYSRRLALRNWEWLTERIAENWPRAFDAAVREQVESYQPCGPIIGRLHRPPRPGVVSIEDLFQTADDFHLLRTTRQSVREFLDNVSVPVDLTKDVDRWRTIMPIATPSGESLQVIDRTGKRWLTLRVDPSAGYTTRRGIEQPKIIID